MTDFHNTHLHINYQCRRFTQVHHSNPVLGKHKPVSPPDEDEIFTSYLKTSWTVQTIPEIMSPQPSYFFCSGLHPSPFPISTLLSSLFVASLHICLPKPFALVEQAGDKSHLRDSSSETWRRDLQCYRTAYPRKWGGVATRRAGTVAV